MSQINGIGGTFIFSQNPAQLVEWYRENLGIDFEHDGAGNSFWKVYFGLDPRNPECKLDQTLAIMKAKIPLPSKTHEPKPPSMYGDQPFMLNLRVDDLEALLDHLRAKGNLILGHEDLEYGKFAWVYDLDGNRLELYEPAKP